MSLAYLLSIGCEKHSSQLHKAKRFIFTVTLIYSQVPVLKCITVNVGYRFLGACPKHLCLQIKRVHCEFSSGDDCHHRTHASDHFPHEWSGNGSCHQRLKLVYPQETREITADRSFLSSALLLSVTVQNHPELDHLVGCTFDSPVVYEKNVSPYIQEVGLFIYFIYIQYIKYIYVSVWEMQNRVL